MPNQWTKVTLEDRFWSQVNKNGPVVSRRLGRCWIWQGATTSGGYGNIKVDGKFATAHRTAWFLVTNQWPNPCALHKCDNRRCIRFSHLFEGTYKDNGQDAKRKGRMLKKLTLTQVQSILSYKGLQRVIAASLGITQSHVSRIKSGKE